MANKVVHMTVCIGNGKGLKAMGQAIRLAADIASEQPWNDDAKRLLKMLRIAMKELRPASAESNGKRLSIGGSE